MIPLAEHIDRLAHHTKAIQETAYHIKRDYAGGPGPFTRAVLETPLGDLIRDVDPSELGLFDLITPVVNRPQEHDPRNAPHPEIARAEFPGATPLRKPPSRREDPHKAPEIEPEVYAKAALKYIDRYEFIRPMPRAYSQAALITEQLVTIRSNIQNLNETLKHAQAAEAPDMKSLADVEEQRVKELQETLKALKKRKQAALEQHQRPTHGRRAAAVVTPEPIAQESAPSPQEDLFWNTPAAAARTLRFTDNLMDEEFDPGNNTTVTLMTPQASTSAGIASHEDVMDQSLTILPPSLSARALPAKDTAEISLDLVPIFEPHSSDRPQSPATVPEPPPPQDSPAPPGEKRYKIKINSEVEKIVVKIWNAAGDIIMPGHSFDGTAGRKPPRAKETIAHLQTISQALPFPDSPSASSVSSAVATGFTQPSSQQILTAHLLVSLLSSPPQFSLPLSKVKELLAEKAGLGPASAGQSSTRVLYGCVAKRLIRIERGGGEQVVKFDI